jgi:hypothetical protein
VNSYSGRLPCPPPPTTHPAKWGDLNILQENFSGGDGLVNQLKKNTITVGETCSPEGDSNLLNPIMIEIQSSWHLAEDGIVRLQRLL